MEDDDKETILLFTEADNDGYNLRKYIVNSVTIVKCIDAMYEEKFLWG